MLMLGLLVLGAAATRPGTAAQWGAPDEHGVYAAPVQDAGLRPPPPVRPGPQGGDTFLAPPRPERSLSAGEAAKRAQQMNGGGRVLSVEPATNGYRVKLLKDGEVNAVLVPD